MLRLRHYAILLPYWKIQWYFRSAVESKRLPKAHFSAISWMLLGLYFNSDGGTQQWGGVV